MDEQRVGANASSERYRLLSVQGADSSKAIESFLATFLGGFHVTQATTSKLDTADATLTIHYEFTTDITRNPLVILLIVRPRVIGEKATRITEKEPRKFLWNLEKRHCKQTISRSACRRDILWTTPPRP